MKDCKNTAKLAAAMLIFGTIGIFRNYIPLPSGFVATVRGLVGALTLGLILLFLKNKLSFGAVKKNLLLLLISGSAIGINWILLFEAYRYTSVASATLCYYMAPVFVIIVSPFLLKERLGLKKCLCVLGALLGMVFVSGVFESDGAGSSRLLGILFGLLAALFYASVIILNKKMKDIGSYEMTLVQLFVAGAVVLPYSLICEDISGSLFDIKAVILLLVVGAVHTGFAYALYFGSIKALDAQKAAIFSYIDPVFAIILSAVVLREELTLPMALGAVLILSSMLISEINFKKRR